MTARLRGDSIRLSSMQQQQMMLRSPSMLARCWRRVPLRLSNSLVSAGAAAGTRAGPAEGYSGRALASVATAAGHPLILPLARHGAISRSAFGRQWSKPDICRAAGAMGLHAHNKHSSPVGDRAAPSVQLHACRAAPPAAAKWAGHTDHGKSLDHAYEPLFLM